MIAAVILATLNIINEPFMDLISLTPVPGLEFDRLNGRVNAYQFSDLFR